jgi:hypothetical protein
MKRMVYAWLAIRAIYELLRYDVIVALHGFGTVQRQIRRQGVALKTSDDDSERAICDAMLLATCFDWKPVLCLQRSACLVRLLRKNGVFGRLVMGYRPAPFFSHAWAEVNGRVLNTSQGYKDRLEVLCTI